MKGIPLENRENTPTRVLKNETKSNSRDPDDLADVPLSMRKRDLPTAGILH